MKHGKMLRRLTALALSAAMAVSSAFADVWVDKEATDLNEAYQITEQLRIGGTEESHNKAAVLFVLDYSTSVSVRNAAAEMLDVLKTKNNTDIQVAVVNYWADSDDPNWTKLDANTDTESLLRKTQEGGTNLHGGLVKAKSLLNSNEIEGYTTYLILISDGLTYLWTEGDTTQSVWYQQGTNGEYSIQNGNSVIEMKYPGSTSGSSVEIPEDVFTDLVTGDETIKSKYEATRKYFLPFGEDLEDNPYISFQQDWSDEEGHTADDFLIGTEIAIYKSAEVFNELLEMTDNVYALKKDENHWGQYPYGEQLMDYLIGISDSNTLKGEGTIDDNTASEVFSSITNQILYEVESGKVTDPIGSDFEWVGMNTVKLSVDGEEITPDFEPSADAESVTFADGNYVVKYKDHVLTWEINTPIKPDAGVVLSYDLTLIDRSEGTHYPNSDAVFEFTGTDGTNGEKELPDPEVKIGSSTTPGDCGDDNDKPSGGGDNDRYEGPDLTVVKVDEDGETIESNARFRIYKEQGSKTMWYKGNQSWSEDEEDAWIFNTSVGDGSFTAYDLKPGTYYIVEISAPEGYDLAEEPLEVEVESRDVTVEFVNSGGGVVTTPTKPVPDTGR